MSEFPFTHLPAQAQERTPMDALLRYLRRRGPEAVNPTSQRLGFEQAYSKPFGTAAQMMAAGAGGMGLEAAPWVRGLAHNLQAGQARIEAQHPEVYQAEPGRLGTFAGDVTSAATVPGGGAIIANALEAAPKSPDALASQLLAGPKTTLDSLLAVLRAQQRGR